MHKNGFEPFSLPKIVQYIQKQSSSVYILNYDYDNMMILNDIIDTAIGEQIDSFDISRIGRIIPPNKGRVLWLYSNDPLTWQQAIDQKTIFKSITDNTFTILISHNISYFVLSWLYRYAYAEFAVIKKLHRMMFPNRPDYIKNIKLIYNKEDENKQLYNIVVPALYSKIAHVNKLEYLEGLLDTDKSKISSWKVFFSQNKLSKYEIVKLDSIYKVKKEKDNYDMLESNYISDILYHVSEIAEFPEEFMGAISSFPDSRFDNHTFNLKTFRKAIQTNISDIPRYYEKLSKNLDKFYEISSENCSHDNNNIFALYVQKIFGRVMDLDIYTKNHIATTPEPERKLLEFTISQALEHKFNIQDHFYDKKKKIKGQIRGKIVEIDLRNKQMTVQLDTNQELPPMIRLNLDFALEVCKQHLHKLGMKEGKTVFIKGGKDTSFLNRIKSQITTIMKVLSPFQQIEIEYDSEKKSKYRERAVKGMDDNIRQNKRNIIKNHLYEISDDASKIYEVFLENYKIINAMTIKLANEQIYNPLYLLHQYSIGKKVLYQDKFGLAHGDLNLDNIVISYNPDNKRDFEIRFIDIASLGFDYPLSFDYVKLETEIKTHILSTRLFKLSNNNERISVIKHFERTLQKDFDEIVIKNKKPDFTHIHKGIHADLEPFYRLILNIRYDAYKRYNDAMAGTLYRQQLLFYNLKTLTYNDLVKDKVTKNYTGSSVNAKLWALISASICTEILLTGKAENEKMSIKDNSTRFDKWSDMEGFGI